MEEVVLRIFRNKNMKSTHQLMFPNPLLKYLTLLDKTKLPALRQDPASVHAFIEVMKIKVHQTQPHASPQTGILMINDKTQIMAESRFNPSGTMRY